MKAELKAKIKGLVKASMGVDDSFVEAMAVGLTDKSLIPAYRRNEETKQTTCFLSVDPESFDKVQTLLRKAYTAEQKDLLDMFSTDEVVITNIYAQKRRNGWNPYPRTVTPVSSEPATTKKSALAK